MSCSIIEYNIVRSSNGGWELDITFPIKQKDNKGMKGFELNGFAPGLIPIKKDDGIFYYQSPEHCEDGMLFYYTASDDPEFEENIIEFIDTNVIFDCKRDVVPTNVRRFLSMDKIGEMIAIAQMMMRRNTDDDAT